MIKIKQIPLTQEKFALVDDEDYEYLNQWKWCAYKAGKCFYATRSCGIPNSTKRFLLLMHHAVIGKKEGLEVDHINGNGLDNRRENLRHVTHRQNAQNKHINKSSKYPGVCWSKNAKAWESGARINGKIKYLGYYPSEIEAFNAYCAALVAINETVLVNQ